MDDPARTSLYVRICRVCGKELPDAATGHCPRCGAPLDLRKDRTYRVATEPASPFLAVLSALFVFGSAAFAILVLVIGAVCRALGVPWDPGLVPVVSSLLVPCMCVPGVFLGHAGYERYRNRNQTVGMVVTGLSIGFGWAVLGLTMLGLLLLTHCLARF